MNRMWGKGRSKYRNTKTVTKDGSFDSKKENKRYKELLLLEKAGVITSLQRQVKFVLIPAQYEQYTKQLKTKTKTGSKCIHRQITYRADYTYYQDGVFIVEDAKACKDFQDPVYKIKKKLMRYIHNIEIKETY